MAVKRGLGKGLDSLISPKALQQSSASGHSDSNPDDESGRIMEVPISDVEPNRAQPRKHFDEEALQELAESIQQHGVLQPILVRRQADYYEIIAGERRWRAAKKAGLKAIPVLVREASDRERNEIALIENLQREDLDPIEEAKAYQQLIDTYDLTQDEVAQRVSRSRSAVTNSLRLLRLDERVQEMLQKQQISSGHARALLPLVKKGAQYETAQQVMERHMSVRETEELVQKLKDTSEKKTTGDGNQGRAGQQKSAVYAKIEEQLRDKLGTRVLIRQKDEKGKIEISYYGTEELQRILDLLL